MSNPITVACAPCCWGVDDVSNPHLPPWERVLDEAAQAGFGGLELGPYGYMPLDSARVGAALEAPYLTVMEWGHDERDYAAGHSDRAPRLNADAWAGMVDNIRAIADLARERHGVRAVIHPHAGGYIEFEDELDRIADDVPSETAGLCLDTGHLDYSGMDLVATLRRYAGRTDYIHFKDIDPAKYTDVMSRRIRFFDACAEGVMCPIGRGRIDYVGIRKLLTELGYGGYITIEQERDPRNSSGVLADLAASREFLRRSSF